MTFHMINTIFFYAFCNALTANAYVTYYRTRPSLGSVIAGAVVGFVVLVATLVLACIFIRRRKRKQQLMVHQQGGLPVQTGFYPQPQQGYYPNYAGGPQMGQTYNQGVGASPMWGGAQGQPGYNMNTRDQNPTSPQSDTGTESSNQPQQYQPPTHPPPGHKTEEQSATQQQPTAPPGIFSPPPGPPPALIRDDVTGGFRH